jgi:hypothetical protein
MFPGWSVGYVLCLWGFVARPIPYQSRWIAKDCKLRKLDSNESRCRIQGFPYFPPQGENWCVRSMASQGFTFLKHPANVEIPAQPPSPSDLFQVVLQAVRFMGMALALPEFGTQPPSPEQLKAVVDELISNSLFLASSRRNQFCRAAFPTGGVTFRDRPVFWCKLRPVRRESGRARRFPSTARCCHQPELFQQFSMCPPTTYVCQEQFGMDQLRGGLP